jgi:hypothetical protein
MRAISATRRKQTLPLALCLSAVFCQAAFAKKITLAAQVTATKSTPYRYTFAGSDYTTCALTTKDDGMTYEQNCGHRQASPQETTHMGYILRLESSGHRVMDVSCSPGVALWSGSPRDCTAPENGSTVQVEINGDKAKLMWTAAPKTAAKPSSAAQTKPIALSETYKVIQIDPPF